MIASDVSNDRQNYSDRRRWWRKSTELYAVLRFELTVQPAWIIDVSVGGMQLRDIGRLQRGMPLTLQLIGGETFQGHVAWSGDDKIGLRFNWLIDGDHDIFRAKRGLILPSEKRRVN